MPESESLAPSKLGTKEYWDEFYSLELKNYEEINDIGQVWFGQSSVDKMVKWIQTHVPESDSILDIGCGNGHLLGELQEVGYTNLIGVDYSENSVKLAHSVFENIRFEQLDVVDMRDVAKYAGLYNVCTDKGTFDAISLSTRKDFNYDLTKSPCQAYVDNIACMLTDGGILLITSCNWTEEELRSKFEPAFEFHSQVKYPTFQFGGVVGQQVVTIALKKK